MAMNALRRITRCSAATILILWTTNAAQAALKISSQPTRNVTCSKGVCTATASRAVLNSTDLANMLSGSDIKVVSGGQARDMEIAAALSWTSTSRLTLDAYRSIAFDKPISVTGTGALTIATNDGGSGGDFRFSKNGHVKFWDDNSALTINGNGYALAKSMNKLVKLAKRRDAIALAGSFDAGGKSYPTSPIPQLGGVLEGLGNTISNLTINDSKLQDTVGLIGLCQCIIRDIGLESVNIQSSNGQQNVGSLAGVTTGSVIGAHAAGQISVAGDRSVAGGLVGGIVAGTISRSYSAVIISGATYAGGLTANTDGSIDQSYATGSLSAGENSILGGLVGVTTGVAISNSYSLNGVTGGSETTVGGLIGMNQSNNAPKHPSPAIDSIYSIGVVSGAQGATLGGVVGQDLAGGFSNSYWDLDTSGISDPSQGAGNIPNDPGITGLSDAQLKSGLPAGFDPAIWGQNPKINNGYPYLLNNPPR
jgi:hypothetical protein